MSQLHIFNPSHDEALAANSPYYYPAKAARTLGSDLSMLPVWWANEGDGILIPDDLVLPNEVLYQFADRGLRLLRLAELRNLSQGYFEKILPWGWDPLLVHQLSKAGTEANLLPNTEQLAVIRRLSSRQTAVQLLRSLRAALPQTIGCSAWCTDEQQVEEFLKQQGEIMLKAPWSSSGRGVFSIGPNLPDAQRLRVRRILKEQGGIEAEPLYHRLSDFALEFEVQNEEVCYLGISVFATNENGAYTGNIVSDETTLLQQIPPTILKDLPQVIECLTQELTNLLLPHYEGPLGIDLMIVQTTEGNIALHPCVEINLRRTMGHVALALRKEIPDGKMGIYRIQPISATDVADSHTLRLTPYAKQMEAVLNRML